MKRVCVDLWLTESSEENIQEKPAGDRPDTVVSLLYGRGWYKWAADLESKMATPDWAKKADQYVESGKWCNRVSGHHCDSIYVFRQVMK